MESDYLDQVRREYAKTKGDATALFQTILALAGQIGMDQALALLEQCVIEKRLTWVEQNAVAQFKTGQPLVDGYNAFYEGYLGLATLRDGEIVSATETRMVTRWWNPCPTLEACRKLGLDTREICRKVYHQPVQVFLTRIHPQLRFNRNYDAIRPYAPYCEEIIELDKSA